MKKQVLIIGTLVLFILLLDQWIKIWVKSNFVIDNQYGTWTKEPIYLIGDWFKLNYTENQGMAFGTTFGSGIWSKLALSIFRIAACIGLIYYWIKQAKKGVKTEYLLALGLIFAGAFGNLIDSMFYDFVFKDSFYPCMDFNILEGSGNWVDCTKALTLGKVEVRNTGFLLGNVVDMFQFDLTWPSWVPLLGGENVFPAIWNVADASISSGIILILFRQRAYFSKKT